MWVLAHRAVQEFHSAAAAFPFFHQHHLMHVVARQPVWTGEQHTIQDSAFHAIAESVQPRTIQIGSAVAVIPENVGRRQRLALKLQVLSQPLQLLFNRLSLGLTVGRYAQINRSLHISPPLLPEGETKPLDRGPGRSVGSIPGDVGRPGPTAARHSWSAETDDGLSTVASFAPPRCSSSRGYAPESTARQGRVRGRRAYRNSCRLTRLRQNLSFV